MISISLPASGAHALAPACRTDGLSIRVTDSLAEIEATWRTLEAEGDPSPYQRFDWVAAFAAAMLAAGESLRVAVVHEADGRPVMLLPLVIAKRYGFKVASPLGGKHANFNLPLIRHGFLPEPAEARSLLTRIGQALAVDLLVSRNAPVTWTGAPNPLAAGGRASPSNAYKLTLSSDADATLARVASSHARKKLRNKERGLAQVGAVGVLEARTVAEIDLILDALWLQKRRRYQELGISDPYSEADAQAFVRRACLAGLAEGKPAIELHALTLDGAVIAAFGGAADARRISGMFISFDATSETAKFSPGEILVAHIIRLQCARGRIAFDLGVGEARYKRTFCDEVEHLADNVIGITLPGRGYGRAVTVGIDLKRRFKASPRAMRLLAWARRRRASLTAE